MIPSTQTIEKTILQNSKKSYKKYIWITLLFLIALGGAIYYKFYNKKNTIAYQIAPVEIKNLTTTVSATGNLEPINSVDVGIEVSGTIREVLVDFNSRVRAGEIMAKLDTTRLSSSVASSKAALMRYEANVAEAKASLTYAQKEWERVDMMYTSTNGNYPSRKELDEALSLMQRAKALHDAAIAQTKQSHAELTANEDNLRKAIVIAPIDGIVLERKAEQGQTVVAAMQTPILFKMAENLTKMRVILSVDEADIGEVHEGQRVQFSVDAYADRKFDGTITQVRLNPEIINGVVTYDTVVEVDNKELLLRPGMTASASITTGVLQNVLCIPNAALRFTPQDGKKEDKEYSRMSHVWILHDNKPLKVALKSTQSDGTFTAIEESTLNVGDSVIIGIKRP